MISETTKSAEASNLAVSRSAFKVSLGGLFSLLAGLGSQVVVASIFGADAEMDAYLTALVVPVYIEAVLLAGLPFVFIPIFIRKEASGHEQDAWKLAGTFFWLVGGILTIVAIGGAVFSQQIISITAPGLNPGKADLAAQMLALLIFAAPFIGLGTLTRGIQNAKNKFFWPAMASAIGSVGNVVIVLLLYRTVGPMALALGYLVSQGMRAGVSAVPVLRHGWGRILPLNHPQVREMAKLILPFLLLGLFARWTPIFTRFFASGLPDGELSYLGYASKISGMLLAVIGVGVVRAFFPAMARAYTHDGEEGLVEKAKSGLRLSLAISLPTLAILSALAIPLVGTIFERGAFNRVDTLGVARILPIMLLLIMVFRTVGNLITRVFYVAKDTRTVPIVVATTSVLYIFLARGLTEAWGYVGLAIAAPIHSGLGILILSFLLTRKLGLFRDAILFRSALMYGLASIAAFLAARFTSIMLDFMPDPLMLISSSIVAASLYLAIMLRIDREISVSILEITGIRRVISGARLIFRPASEGTLR